MTKYQLVKLIQWAKKIKARKRLHKIVFLLQKSGCSLNADFGLHLYGPYSRDLASLLNDAVTSGFLKETRSTNSAGTQFAYELKESGSSRIKKYEKTSSGKKELNALQRIKPKLKLLMAESLRTLELAATIAFFHKRNNSWEDAAKHASEFKKEKEHSNAVQHARAFAELLIQ